MTKKKELSVKGECNCHYQCGCDKGKCNCYSLKDMDTKDWEKEFDKLSQVGMWCGCFEGDLNDLFPKQQQKVKDFIKQTISTEVAKAELKFTKEQTEFLKQATKLLNKGIEIVKGVRLDQAEELRQIQEQIKNISNEVY